MNLLGSQFKFAVNSCEIVEFCFIRQDIREKYAPKPMKKVRKKNRNWSNAIKFATTDYFEIHSQNETKWKRKYGTFSPDEVLYLFSLIEDFFPKPRTSTLKKMNKLLLWLNFVHADVCDWNAFSEQWEEISDKSCMNYIDDVLGAILRAFKGTPQILDCPMTDEIRQRMFDILQLNEAKFANALVSIDGKASRMYGRGHKELRCFKFKFRAAQNHMNIYDRVLGLSIACSIGNAGHNSDKGIFNRHHWSKRSTLLSKLKEYLMFADTGYIGSDFSFVAYKPKVHQID